MKRVIQYILVTLMFAVPLAGFMTISNDYVIKSENRMISRFPEKYSKKYFSELVKWYTDRLFYKIKISENYYPYFNSVFEQSVMPSDSLSVAGLKNWYFISDLSNKAYSQHCRDVVFEESQIIKKLNYLKSLSEASTAPFYLVIGPDKHGIYSEFMKPYIYEPGKFRAFSKYKYLLTKYKISYIDPYEAIKTAKASLSDNKTLYYTNDTHWNYFGAYTAFAEVIKHVAPEVKIKNYIFKFEKNYSGDLVANRPFVIHDYYDSVSVENFEKYNIEIEKIGQRKRYSYLFDINATVHNGTKFINSLAEDRRKVMIFSDSFGWSFVPFMIDTFHTVIWLERNNPKNNSFVEIIKKEKPDLILYLNVERNVFD